MDEIHCFQDLFPTSKLVHSSVIVSGQEFLCSFNVLTVEKIIFLYLYSILNKLAYSIFQFYVVMRSNGPALATLSN
jgi:hypothetical protein